MLVTGFWEPKKKPPLGGGFGFDMAYRGHYYVSRIKNRSQIGYLFVRLVCIEYWRSYGAKRGYGRGDGTMSIPPGPGCG